MKVAYRIEHILHKRYARYRLSGEWFNVTPKRVLKDIGFVRALSPYLDDVTVSVPDDEEAPEGLPCKPEPRGNPFANPFANPDRRYLPGSSSASPLPRPPYPGRPPGLPKHIANPFASSHVQSANNGDDKSDGTLGNSETDGD